MKLLEDYVSVQGEGPNVGAPTRFLRFAGCNLRCPGWPCDTQHAIQPEQYVGKSTDIDKSFAVHMQPYPRHICITGGEPLIQRHMGIFIQELLYEDRTVDLFTNGTMPLPEVDRRHRLTVIMDWKLPGSGEDPLNERRLRNLSLLAPGDAIKFVVKDEFDLGQAIGLYRRYALHTPAKIYVGAVWGTIPDSTIVETITEHRLPWYLNVQMHKYIWDPEETLR